MILSISHIMKEALTTATQKGFRDQDRPLAVDIADAFIYYLTDGAFDTRK